MRILRLALPMAFPDRSPAQDYQFLLWDTVFTGLFAVAADLNNALLSQGQPVDAC
jgi:hypothetical protein